MYLLETANIIFLSFIRYELLSFEHGNSITQNVKYKSLALLLGYKQVFVHTEVLDYLPIYIPHILSIPVKPHWLLWEILDSSIFVCTS